MVTKFALLIGRRGTMLAIASMLAALLGAKAGLPLRVSGFWDGPH